MILSEMVQLVRQAVADTAAPFPKPDPRLLQFASNKTLPRLNQEASMSTYLALGSASLRMTFAIAIASLTVLTASTAFATIIIPTSPVGNPGNAPETTINGTYGSVAYRYSIATTEVTNAQYAAFLNAVAATDTFSLYNTGMAGAFGGITQAGAPGSHTYATVSGRANHPVNFVSFWDAARFANWMENGQPAGPQTNATTEDGTYTLTSAAMTANTVTRNAGIQWAVTSTNEWYKAAYHQPASQGGDGDNYWLYPTSSNTAPTGAQANYLPSSINNTTAVASYAANYYGAFDLAGNVYEINDSIPAGPFRGPSWGGAYDNIAGWLTPLNAILNLSTAEREQVGFRMVLIPEPTSLAVVTTGLLTLTRRRRV
jgi:formylglycine-generating enzyme